jgi:hypothetical protein
VTNAESRLYVASIVMRVDSITVEIVRALRADGVEPILLKGPAIANWLYEELGDRIYYDSDLLVSARDLPAAETTLRRIGFGPGQRGWLSKSRDWSRGGESVDVHTSLYGVGTDDGTAWTLLSADAPLMDIDGTEVRTLRLSARTFHLATHAAQHDDWFSAPKEDIKRALAIVPTETWRQAAALAHQLRATGTFAAGLRRAGATELLAELGLEDVPTPAAAALFSATPTPTALGISQLAAAGSLGGRIAVLARGVAPRPDYMRVHYALARRSSAGLVAAYVLRLVHLSRHLPSGIRAWREARKG